jgi:hypothetical protein
MKISDGSNERASRSVCGRMDALARDNATRDRRRRVRADAPKIFHVVGALPDSQISARS